MKFIIIKDKFNTLIIFNCNKLQNQQDVIRYQERPRCANPQLGGQEKAHKKKPLQGVAAA
jgi:hypothetical protein